jgi:hypothetical protein
MDLERHEEEPQRGIGLSDSGPRLHDDDGLNRSDCRGHAKQHNLQPAPARATGTQSMLRRISRTELLESKPWLQEKIEQLIQ